MQRIRRDSDMISGTDVNSIGRIHHENDHSRDESFGTYGSNVGAHRTASYQSTGRDVRR